MGTGGGEGSAMGWEDDLTTLARERGSALVAYAYLLTGEMAGAQDLVQDALVATFSRLRAPSATGVEHLEAYVRQAILHTFCNARRRAGRCARSRTGSTSPTEP